MLIHQKLFNCTCTFLILERLRLAQAERAMNPKNRSKNSAMQKTQERKRQREEDDEEDNDHGPQFAVNPSSLGIY